MGMYNVHVQCTLCNVHYIMYSIQSNMRNINMNFHMYNAPYTMYIMKCTMYNVHINIEHIYACTLPPNNH